MPKKSKLTISSIIKDRKSVRGFLNKKVPLNKIKKIFELAQHAPSNCNIQPWFSFISSGKSIKNLRKKFLSAHNKKIKPNPDYKYPANFKFDIVYLSRQVNSAKTLYDSMEINRNDKKKREKAFLMNYKFYNAPHVCFVGMNKNFDSSIAIDVGIYIQTLMLAMKTYGISSCAQATLRDYPDIIRKELGISKNINILLGISFGYFDKKIKANKTLVGRSNSSENIKFIN
tara:strand:- start:972 stop:1658 length:687 start_codon:yes stop_codon:yes gene_type:complete